MAKVCYLINHADDIIAVLGVNDAKTEAARRGINLVVAAPNDLKRMNSSTLVQLYNTTIKKFPASNRCTTKRFETKSRAAERVFELFQETYGTAPIQVGGTAKGKPRKDPVPVDSGGRQVYAKPGKGINLPPRDFRKTPRTDSKRAAVLALLQRKKGASLEEILDVVGRSTKSGRDHARIFLHDLNRYCGYGIKTVSNDIGNPVYKTV